MGQSELQDNYGTSSEVMPREPWPGLAVSRVIGHTGVQTIGIVPEPAINSFTLTSSDRCIIIASDGVWDFIDEQEACNIVRQLQPDAEAACRLLVDTASRRWVEDDPSYRDDISAIVVFFPLDNENANDGTYGTHYINVNPVDPRGTVGGEGGLASSALRTNEDESGVAPDGIWTSISSWFSGNDMTSQDPTINHSNSSILALPTPSQPTLGPSGHHRPKSILKGDNQMQATKQQRRKSVVTRFG